MDFSLPVDTPPLISVLIRSMNRPSLAATLESVARQQWPNLEIIIVAACGASHPEPPARVLDHPVRLVRSERPLRRSEAANAGLDAARGDLLCFLDDDDALLPGHFEPLVEALRAHPQAVAAYSGTSAETPDGHVLRVYGRPFDRTDLYLENCFPIHSVLFRREAVQAGARFDPAFDLCEDWDFWLQLARCGDFVYCEAVTALYRITEDGGYALQGDGQTAYLAERAVLEKWRTLHSADALHAIAERGRLVRPLQHERLQLLAQAQEAQQEAEELHVELQQRDEHIRAQDARIQELLRSHSWRITAPLRTLSLYVRQGRRAWHALRAMSGAQRRDLLRHLA
ncbi:MAG: glycosyltransferase, partial [Rhodocyclaceae bacterium]|nr:glycosyltransferase [Rhodocyclaceae bacterium]